MKFIFHRLILSGLFLSCVFVLLPAPSRAQVGEQMFVDGIMWKQLDTSPDQGKLEKACYIRGYYDGMNSNESVAGDRLPSDVSCERLVKSLNQFYTDSENVKIPAFMGLVIYGMKQKGSSQADIDGYTKELREFFGPPPPTTGAAGGPGKTLLTRAASVFSGPGGSFSIVGTLPKGAAIRVHEEKNGWCHFSEPGYPSGWVPKRFTSTAD